MNHESFVSKVRAMRDAQKEYFNIRKEEIKTKRFNPDKNIVLKKSKALEHEVDLLLDPPKQTEAPPTMFNDEFLGK